MTETGGELKKAVAVKMVELIPASCTNCIAPYATASSSPTACQKKHLLVITRTERSSTGG